MRVITNCTDIADEIDSRLAEGYRLEMIFPADSPRVAEMSRGDETIRIEQTSRSTGDGEWHVGRAGMEYRDLVPDRLEGRVIASHIRIPNGGPIPDYVHYHHVEFQIIYCLAGTARVVYEDQGEAFEFNAGDCILQPPGIRHRVLECTNGFEVLEVGSPAEHPTFAEYSFDLPTSTVDRDRDFGGQRFVRHRSGDAPTSEMAGLIRRDTGIRTASAGAGDVYVLSSDFGSEFSCPDDGCAAIAFVAKGAATFSGESLKRGDAVVLNGKEVRIGPQSEIVVVEVRIADQSSDSKP